ncbi:PSD1 and planctomycete cytochrome C domain-containing protein [Aeoliella sp. SH292]|uniref:PSD1 and planctomycete cytochrome C domain-containing protein n=1 Tax=Aeoliella sp. SH292 TaxID=3454464 RepID=UPI003F9CA009
MTTGIMELNDHRRNLLVLGMTWALLSCPRSTAEEPTAKVDFAHQIVPVLKQHCAECHSGTRAEGGFSINNRGLLLEAGVVTEGDSDDSYLMELITTDDEDIQMPPPGKPRVAAEQVSLVRSWIDERLPWEPGFTFAENSYEPPLLPRRPELPPVVAGRANPVDRIIDAHLEETGVPRPAPLGDAAFYRRVSLDLVGLLPSAEEVEAFVADTSPNKREQLVDRLLEDRVAYAQHWMSFWNDLLRNEYDGTGYVDGGRRPIGAWLYRSLMENKPYDQFVRELIDPTDESRGFINGIKWRGSVNASQTNEIQFAQNVPQVFLGINLKCASCHDSFIDRWTLEETYALAAVYSDHPLEIHRCDKPIGKQASAAWLFPEIGEVDANLPRDERLEQLSKLMTHKDNGRFTRTMVNRLWCQLMGRGIVHPTDSMQTEPWNEDLLDWLAVDLVDNGYDLKSTLRTIATSEAYQSQASKDDEQPQGNEFAYHGPIAKRMTAEQFVDAVWQLTGTGPTKPHDKANEFLTKHDGEQRAPNERYRSVLVASDLLMRSLGRPNREQVVTSRPPLLTTLQALDLSNSPTLVTTLHEGATQLATKWEDKSDVEVVETIYVDALSRKPTDKERTIAVSILEGRPRAEGLEDLLWAVTMLPEFQIIR